MIRKAKAGVTLVELLVVILIVTILSVSLLPLLKPFVVESQYAAEAIPVIGNLRTKIGLYQYDKGNLPTVSNSAQGTYTNVIETWCFSADGKAKSTTVSDVYIPAVRTPAASSIASDSQVITAPSDDYNKFFGNSMDIDNQDLAGKRCKPVHFQYMVCHNGSSYCYVIGCFGDNNGLPEGTGYAVCEINVKGADGNVYKQIGTWKRYKAATDGQITFGTVTAGPTDPTAAKKSSTFCPIPDPSLFATSLDASAGKLTIVGALQDWGWEF